MDDADLLAAAATGDADAFATFYRRHLALVVGFGVRATGNREVAFDLTAEIFAAALASCGRYRPEYETAAPWLIGIAQNKLRESLRRGRVQDAVRRRLEMHSIELDDDDIERIDEERDYADLAAELQCSQAVVRQRVSRGLARVRT